MRYVNCASVYRGVSIRLDLSTRVVSTNDDGNSFQLVMQDHREAADESRQARFSYLVFLSTAADGGEGREHGEYMINARETRDLI